MTPAELWSAKYAERFAELRAREEQFRAEAFLEVPRFIAGEPVRVMTPADLHVLDGVGNAFICGQDPDVGDLAAMIWRLHARRPVGRGLRYAWAYGRFLGRLRRRDKFLAEAVADVRAYLDFVFFDAPSGDTSDTRHLGASFLVPLLGVVAAEIGPLDPVSGRPWGSVPLPQIFAWQKLCARRLRGRDYVERNPSDRLLSDFAAELNQPSS